MPTMRLRSFLLALALLVGATLVPAFSQTAPDAPATESPAGPNSTEVLRSFDRAANGATVDAATDRSRRWVMFFMGAPLLLLLLVTAGLGIAMGVYGKQVYIPHMVFAGLSLTLALVHAVVGLVWFRPF
jgi:hypothetical protein